MSSAVQQNELRQPSERLSERRRRNQQSKDQTPRWVIPMTGATGKTWLKKRINILFQNTTNQKTHAETYKEWKTISARNNPPYPQLLEIAVNKLKSKTVRLVKNHKSVENRQKAEFLEPFDASMEEKAWEIIDDNPKSPPKQKEQDKPDEDDPIEFLNQHCRNIKLPEPKYTLNTETDSKGTRWYIATVTHDKDQTIYGVGHSESEEEIKVLAAHDAVFSLKDTAEQRHGPDDANEKADGTTEDHTSNSDESNNNEQRSSTQQASQPSITKEDIKTEALEVIKNNMESLMTTHFETMMKTHFDNLLTDSINRMKTTFETILKPIAETTVNSVVASTTENKVNNKFTTTIKTEITKEIQKEVQNSITEDMKKQVLQAATTPIEKTAKQNCDDYFNKTTKPAIEKVQQESTDSINKVSKEKFDAFVKRANRDILEITTNRSGAKKDVKTLYDKCLKDLQESADKHKKNMNKEIEKHTETIEDAAGEAIENIAGVAEHQVNEIYVAANKGKTMAKTQKYAKGANATVTDEYTGQASDVCIIDIHDDDPDDVHYTVEFKNGRQKKISNADLTAQDEVQILRVKPSKLFPDVDVSKLGNPRVSQNPYITPEKTRDDLPSAWDIKNFHSHF